MENCFTIFTKYFLGFLTPLRYYIPLEDNTRFLLQFFRFRGGESSPLPPLRTPLIIPVTGIIPLKYVHVSNSIACYKNNTECEWIMNERMI